MFFRELKVTRGVLSYHKKFINLRKKNKIKSEKIWKSYYCSKIIIKEIVSLR